MVINSSLKQKNVIFVASVRVVVVTMLIVLSTTMCLAATTPKQPLGPQVVFLNPGEPVDRGKGLFWPMTARLMTVAANTFGMQLEVLYAERDHLLMLRQAESVSQRTHLPDYVIMVNEKQAAVKMLQMFKDTQPRFY